MPTYCIYTTLLTLVCTLSMVLASTTQPQHSPTPGAVMDPANIMQHVSDLVLAMSALQEELQITKHEHVSTNQELVSMKAEFHIVQDDVYRLEAKLRHTELTLNQTVVEHSSTLAELTSVKNELMMSETSLSTVEASLKDLQAEHVSTVAELESLRMQHQSAHDKQVVLQTELDMLKTDTRTTESGLAVVKFEVEKQEEEIGKVTSEIDGIQQNMTHGASHGDGGSTNTDLLEYIRADLKSNVEDVSLLRHDLDSVKADISSAHTQMQAVETMMTSLRANVSREIGEAGAQSGHSSLDPLTYSQINSTSFTVSELKDRLGSVESRLLNATYDISHIGYEISSLQTNTSRGGNSKNIGFDVRLQSDLMTVHMGEKLAFDKVQFNQGGGYDVTTGIFTVPRSGTYFFWAQVMMAQAASLLEIHLQRNGEDVGKSYVETPPEWQYAILSLSSLVHVQQGDLVWFYKGRGSDNIYGKLYSGYGAAILSAD